MAQVRPCFLRIGQNFGSISSTLTQPTCLAIVAICSSFQYLLKHHWMMDCLMRPFLTEGCCEVSRGASAASVEPASAMVAADAPAVFSTSRRVGMEDGRPESR